MMNGKGGGGGSRATQDPLLRLPCYLQLSPTEVNYVSGSKWLNFRMRSDAKTNERLGLLFIFLASHVGIFSKFQHKEIH